MEEYQRSQGALALNKSLPEQHSSNAKRRLTLVDGKIRVSEVVTNQEMEQFISLKDEINKSNQFWLGDETERYDFYFNPETTPYPYLTVIPFIATRDGKTVGRICAILNSHYNEYWDENVGFFGFFESIEDQEVANALFDTVVDFLKNNGLDKMYGPISPTIQDEVGILLNDFEEVPTYGLAYNPSYYADLINEYGFQKAKDLLHPTITVDELEEGVMKKIEKLGPFIEDPNIIARYFDWDNLERDAEIVRDLFYNQTFASHWGFYPAEPEEFCKMLEHYRPHVSEELFLILEDAGEAIAFALCFKDENSDILPESTEKKVKYSRQKWDLVGIKPDYRRAGLGTFVLYNLLPGLRANNAKDLCVSWTLEDNLPSLGLMKSVGFHFSTYYRVYQKEF